MVLVPALTLLLGMLLVGSAALDGAPSAPPPVPTTSPGPPAAFRPAPGTWVGALTFAPERAATLYGRELSPGRLGIGSATVVDALPDGRLLAVRDGRVVVLGTLDQPETVAPLPTPGPFAMPIELSPNGGLVAVLDPEGVPHVWELGAPAPVTVPAGTVPAGKVPGGVDRLFWAPDSSRLLLAADGGFYVWEIEGGVDRPGAGRAVAISNRQVAVWGSDGLELRDFSGKVARTWAGLGPGESAPGLEAAFDPAGRFLAVWSAAPENGVVREGLRVLSVSGDGTELLEGARPSLFAWSGDGGGLYWMNALGLQAWSAHPDLTPATLVGAEAHPQSARLRVYDPATVVMAPPRFRTRHLLELRDGSLAERSRETAAIAEGVLSVTSAGLPGQVVTVTKDRRVTLIGIEPPTERLLGTLSPAQLPAGARLERVVAPLLPGESSWYLETSAGEILTGSESGLFTTITKGSSLSRIGTELLYVSGEGTAVRRAAPGRGIVWEATGADRILGMTVAGDTLYLLATDGGGARILEFPVDGSRASAGPAPRVVYGTEQAVTGGALLASPAGGWLTARLDAPAGSTTLLLSASPACVATGADGCLIGSLPGDLLGFSPDGSWLLVDDYGALSAHSTHGRGRELLDTTAPDQVAWIERAG